MTFHSIDTLDDVVGHLFPASRPKPTAAKPSQPGKPKTNEAGRKPTLPTPIDKPGLPGKPTRRPRSV